MLFEFEVEAGVTAKVFPEPDPDWSFIENIEDQSKISSGDLYQVFIVISVFDRTGELEGFDSLGGIIMHVDEDLETQARQTIKDHAMVDEARSELKRKIDAVLAAYQGGAK